MKTLTIRFDGKNYNVSDGRGVICMASDLDSAKNLAAQNIESNGGSLGPWTAHADFRGDITSWTAMVQ